MQTENLAMGIILAIIILVASFNIISTLVMSVNEKRPDIALLKSQGLSNKGIRDIFIFQGGLIGIVGTLSGMLLGLSLCFFLDKFGYKLNADVYYLDKLPVIIHARDVALIVGGSIIVSLLATLYPSSKAAKVPPSAGFRYE